MKVVILAGGRGTRMGDMDVPKPMVEIGGKPILEHVMNIYASFGFTDFIIAMGYKRECIEHWAWRKSFPNGWKVELVDTGQNTLTGGRLKRLEKLIDSTFLLTYGDGVADLSISHTVDFYFGNRWLDNKIVGLLTAVHPSGRFGLLNVEHGYVTSFREKAAMTEWINGGFMVFEPQIFDYISGDDTVLEREPLTRLSKEHRLLAYKHEGYWQCMDTPRDRDTLEQDWKDKKWREDDRFLEF